MTGKMIRFIGILFVLCALLIGNSFSKKVPADTQKLLLELGQTDCDDETESEAAKFRNTGVKFQCDVSNEEISSSSVHQLRPEDIDVVGAIGDSYTAAFGAGANYLGPNAFLEHRGLSFSVGGDEALESHVSIPNILHKYNPNLYGFSEGVGMENSNLNVAVTGATSEEFEAMVDQLIDHLVTDTQINMDEDWKLINVFLGGNDIFDSCLTPRFTPEYFKNLMISSFNTLKAMVPRALVNVMALPDIVELRKMTGVVCDVVHLSMCPCFYAGEDAIKKLQELSKSYNTILEELISSGDFDTDDFAIVYQPVTSTSYVPVAENGRADDSFFAPDCIHLSRKGHASSAYHLWANMLEPVNAKDTMWSPEMGEYLPCPKSPYIYTNRNSATQSVAWSLSANKQQSSPDSKPKSLEGGVIAAIVVLVASVIFISGYLIYHNIFKSVKLRWSYERL
ncbi:phospholipase B1, membrane-associated-like [Amphiura filiformis]|uniref:phospholipase B1, membrane-associated-like n=1 Tax=Amphiura filiformis TaxID=82378 RepID=UPI003B225325